MDYQKNDIYPKLIAQLLQTIFNYFFKKFGFNTMKN
jgi:hypothetical protein